MLLWRQIRIRRQRRHILALLERMEQSSNGAPTPEFLAQLSRLMRRLALMRFPRQEIASLTGIKWLQFLDSSGGDGQFSQGPGKVLAQGPYMRELPNGVDGRALTDRDPPVDSAEYGELTWDSSSPGHGCLPPCFCPC